MKPPRNVIRHELEDGRTISVHMPTSYEDPYTGPRPLSVQDTFYRCLGFPCSVTAEHDSESRPLDATSVAADVSIMSSFFRERNIQPAVPLLPKPGSGAEYSAAVAAAAANDDLGALSATVAARLHSGEPDYPASIVYRTYEHAYTVMGGPYKDRYTFECGNRKPLKNRGNFVLYQYIAGHGLSSKLARRWGEQIYRTLPKGSDGKPYYSAGLAMFFMGQLERGSTSRVGKGDIVGFSILIKAIDILIEFCSGQHGHNRHLVLIIDACSSGQWVRELEDCAEEMVKGRGMSVTIQSAAQKKAVSHGFFFTPLFVKLQKLSAMELNNLVQSWERGDIPSVPSDPDLQLPDQKPRFFSVSHQKIEGTEGYQHLMLKPGSHPVVELNGLRFFTSGRFFNFFAKANMDVFTPPLDAGQQLFVPRPVVTAAASDVDSFVARFLAGEVLVRGMKLSQYQEADGSFTPVMIAAVLSPIKFACSVLQADGTVIEQAAVQQLTWYNLHAHFREAHTQRVVPAARASAAAADDGFQNARSRRRTLIFPGEITHIKLIYCSYSPLPAGQAVARWSDGMAVETPRIDPNSDYTTSRQVAGPDTSNRERYVQGWQQYKSDILQVLQNSLTSQELVKFKNQNEWKRPYPDETRLGPTTYVRTRARNIGTEELLQRAETAASAATSASASLPTASSSAAATRTSSAAAASSSSSTATRFTSHTCCECGKKFNTSRDQKCYICFGFVCPSKCQKNHADTCG